MAPRVLAASAAGASAAAEFGRRSKGRWWRVPAFRALVVAGVAAAVVAELMWRSGRVESTVVGGLVSATAWWGAARVRPEPDPERWLRGAAGERATAALLADLPRRFVVGHDLALPGSRGNIDHVVIGPSGVYVIDSKAYRRRLRVRGGSVWAGEFLVETAPAASQARRVAGVAGVPVTPIIAVHGSGLRRRGVDDGGVWVVPAGRVAAVVLRGRRSWWSRRTSRQLGRGEVKAIAADVATVFERRGSRST